MRFVGQTILVVFPQGNLPIRNVVVQPRGSVIEEIPIPDQVIQLVTEDIEILSPDVLNRRQFRPGQRLYIDGQTFYVSAAGFDWVSPFGSGRGGSRVFASRDETTGELPPTDEEIEKWLDEAGEEPTDPEPDPEPTNPWEGVPHTHTATTPADDGDFYIFTVGGKQVRDRRSRPAYTAASYPKLWAQDGQLLDENKTVVEVTNPPASW